MIKENIPLIFGIVIVVIVLSVIGYYLIRFLKGSIKIKLKRKGFSAGEQIEGEFTLITKKDVEGERLFVSLIGEETIDDEDHDGKRRSSTREIYRYEKTLEADRVFKAGTHETYEFTLETPGEKGQAEGVTNAIAKGIQLFTGHQRRLKWHVEARLDTEGVDIASTEKIRINTF